MSDRPKIEKGIPIPTPNHGPGSRSVVADMEIGDSVFIPNVTTADIGGRTAGYSRRTGQKFTTRTLTENGVKGVRIWRIA